MEKLIVSEIIEPERKRRSYLEMELSILSVLSHQPLIRTHVMYKANVNFSMLTEICSRMISSGLIKYERIRGQGKRRFYRLTYKGNEALKTYRQLRSFVPLRVK